MESLIPDVLPLALSPEQVPNPVFLLVPVAIAALALALAPGRGMRSRLSTRALVIAGEQPSQRSARASGDNKRRRVVEDALREIEAKSRAKARRVPRPTLIGRMRQAGLQWDRPTYLFFSVAAGLASYALAFIVFGLANVTSTCLGFAVGLLLPHLYVSRRRKKRFAAFAAEFPESLDVIVRGIQAGLPLADCLKIISNDGQEPVRGEFKALVHDLTLGVPLDEAMERLAGRVPLSETNFFTIVLTIQARTGGNLSEALGNLSKVLRDRKNMRSKIKALSAEATASASIIACMPVAVALLLYFSSPDYIALLFTSSIGNLALAGSAVWMTIGVMVMRKMINFDF